MSSVWIRSLFETTVGKVATKSKCQRVRMSWQLWNKFKCPPVAKGDLAVGPDHATAPRKCKFFSLLRKSWNSFFHVEFLEKREVLIFTPESGANF